MWFSSQSEDLWKVLKWFCNIVLKFNDSIWLERNASPVEFSLNVIYLIVRRKRLPKSKKYQHSNWICAEPRFHASILQNYSLELKKNSLMKTSESCFWFGSIEIKPDDSCTVKETKIFEILIESTALVIEYLLFIVFYLQINKPSTQNA